MSIHISQEKLLALLLEASAQDHDASTIKAEELIHTWVQQLRPYFTEKDLKKEKV